MRRRKALTAIGGIALTGSGLAVLATDNSQADVGMGDLRIPDTSRSVANPVSAVQLSVSADYEWSTSVTPTRAVLRLEVSARGSTSQIDATTPTPLKPEVSGDHTLSGNLVGDHPAITQADVSPRGGEPARVELTAQVTLAVYNEGEKLGESRVSDDAVLEVSEGKAAIDLSVSGEGSIGVTTSSE